MKTKILEPSHITTELQTQFNTIYTQLITSRKPLQLKELFRQNNDLSLVYCTEGDKVLGFASMGTYTVLSGYKGWIEDVVVDEQARGKGIGKKLILKLIELGKEKELSQILLFTEEHRKAAIHLYTKLGFVPKMSQIYQLKLKKD